MQDGLQASFRQAAQREPMVSNLDGRGVVCIKPIQALACERLLPFLGHRNHRLVLFCQCRIESLSSVCVRFTHDRRRALPADVFVACESPLGSSEYFFRHAAMT